MKYKSIVIFNIIIKHYGTPLFCIMFRRKAIITFAHETESIPVLKHTNSDSDAEDTLV